MRAWPSDHSVAHLIFTDHQHVPVRDEVADAVAHAARKGARAIRTSAMFPAVAEVVLACEFAPIDRLALLSFDLGADLGAELDAAAATGRSTRAGRTPTTGPVERGGTSDRTDRHSDRRSDVRLRSMRPWHLSRCSQIDRDAFGLLWGNTASSLRDIRTATPWHLGRIARDADGIQGFAISGAAADHGYLQRLAVDPGVRRRGIARSLVLDALAWMTRRDLHRALVNTGVDNDGALALYESIGFGRLSDELVIAERRLT
jgi:ribosomal protein S18 acetylase RimI-like enzyme